MKSSTFELGLIESISIRLKYYGLIHEQTQKEVIIRKYGLTVG